MEIDNTYVMPRQSVDARHNRIKVVKLLSQMQMSNRIANRTLVMELMTTNC